MLYYESAKGLGDVFRAIERALIGTRCFLMGTLAVGTNKHHIDLDSAVDYCIDGVITHVAITNDCFTHTDVTVQPTYTTKAYLCCLNIAGSALVVAGNACTTLSDLTTITSDTGVAKLPPVPAGYCPIGYVKIVTANTTFTPGTSDHDKAACTFTFVNLSCIPTSVVV